MKEYAKDKARDAVAAEKSSVFHKDIVTYVGSFDVVALGGVVAVVDSVDHGRMLVLDGFVNIAESDTEAYTHKLMGLPEVKRQEKAKKGVRPASIRTVSSYSLLQSTKALVC